jgi:hypothetical protein
VCRSKYTSYRKSGFVKPFHSRRTPYRIKVFHLGGYIVKEYTGARHKVRGKLLGRNTFCRRYKLGSGGQIGGVIDWAGGGEQVPASPGWSRQRGQSGFTCLLNITGVAGYEQKPCIWGQYEPLGLT